MVLFFDLVGSTELSGRLDPELLGQLIRRYAAEVRRTVESGFDGRIIGQEGDGVLAVFGVPRAHGDDAERAIRAALAVIDAIRELSAKSQRDFGEPISVRAGVHRGQIYREGEVGAVYGLAVNTAARLQALAEADEVVISEEVRRVVGDRFELDERPPQPVKGLPEPIGYYRVVGERSERAVPRREGISLVDRVEEVARLREAWHRVREREATKGVAVVVQGEAGMGKSRLVSTVADEAVGGGARVIELAGSPFFADVELYPIRRLLEAEAGLHGDLDGATRLGRLSDELLLRGLDPVELVPLMAPIVGIEPSAGYRPLAVEAPTLGEQIAGAALRYLTACLGNDPSVLVAEDLQWFDTATNGLLTHLLDRPPRCALLMTARPGADLPAGADTMELEPLTEGDCGTLVDSLVTEMVLRPEARDALIARSDGIPLYIEELVANAQAGVSASVASPADGTDAVPDLLYDLLVARLNPAADLIPIAAAAAVIGREVDLDLLEGVVNLHGGAFTDALQSLHAQGVLEPKQGDASQYRFRHELLREVSYELQPPSRRRIVHGRVADLLIRASSEGRMTDWAVAAAHLELAARVPEAVDAFEHAADAARMRGAFSEARKHLTKALELTVSDIAHDAQRDLHEVSLRLQRGYIGISQEGNASPAAASDYERCLELAASDPGGDEMFKAVIVLWSYHVIRGELSQARRISEFTLRNLEKREWYRKFNLAAFGMIDTWEGNYRSGLEALETYNRARDLNDERRFQSEWFSPSEPVTAILMVLAHARFVVGDDVGGDRQFETAIAHSEGIPFPQGPFSTAQTLSMGAWTRIERGQFDAADALIARFTEISAQHGFDGWTVVAVTMHTVSTAMRMLHAGDPDQGEMRAHAEALHGMTGLWKAVDTTFFLTYYLTVTGVVFAAAGDREAAQAQFGDSLRLGRETGMRFYDVETLRHLAALELNPKGREERLLEALALSREQGAALFELRVAIDLCELGIPAAGDDVRTALSRFGPDAAYPEVARAKALLGAAG